MKPSVTQRLQVFLSHNGVCSRREAMVWVQQGRVSVNGKIVSEPSTPVAPGVDEIHVDGQPVKVKRCEYIILHKPRGYTTTKQDPFAEKTVYDLLPPAMGHLHPVGRLDKDTQGLLLLTNDGGLTHQLTHPTKGVDKTYFVKIAGELSAYDRLKLEKGVNLDGKKTAPAKIQMIHRRKQTALLMTIHEGRKRQIRLMMAHVGQKVMYLKRIRLGPLELGELKVGCWRRLTQIEIERLKV